MYFTVLSNICCGNSEFILNSVYIESLCIRIYILRFRVFSFLHDSLYSTHFSYNVIV